MCLMSIKKGNRNVQTSALPTINLDFHSFHESISSVIIAKQRKRRMEKFNNKKMQTEKCPFSLHPPCFIYSFFDSLFDCYIHLTTFVLDYCSFPSWYLSLENAIYIRFFNGNYKSKITLFLVHFYGMLCVALHHFVVFCLISINCEKF